MPCHKEDEGDGSFRVPTMELQKPKATFWLFFTVKGFKLVFHISKGNTNLFDFWENGMGRKPNSSSRLCYLGALGCVS